MKPSRALIVAFLLTVAVIAISAQTGSPPRVPGVDTAGMDRSVRPQDDFFRFVNGAWADKTPIPADRPSYGTIAILRERSEEAVRGILEAEAIKPAAPGSIGQKVGGFYKSFIDDARIEALGSQPLAAELAAIGAHRGRARLPRRVRPGRTRRRSGATLSGRRPGPAALRRVRRARLAGGSRDARPRLLPAPGRTIRRDS